MPASGIKATGIFTMACVVTLLIIYRICYNDTIKNNNFYVPVNPTVLVTERTEAISLLDCSFANYSKISFIENKAIFVLNEEIHVRIVMYNGRGKRMNRGGDYLRLWMSNKKINAMAPGNVVDHNDGTYSGILRAIWTGKFQIGVLIARRQEELAVNYRLYSMYHSIWKNFAEFRNGTLKETSQCSVARFGNTTKAWCDLSAENAGFPWYCVKPTNPALSCKMWNSIWSYNKPYDDAIDNEEKRIISWSNNNTGHVIRGLEGRVNGQKLKVASPVVPCNKISPEVTWNRKSPNGFFYEDRWHSTQCTDSLTHTPSVYSECLRGRTLYLHGDSTSQQFYSTLISVMKLKATARGHYPLIESNPEYNLTLSWHPHELPFYHGQHRYPRTVNQAQHLLLDSLKNNSRDIVVLYLYVHFTLNHPDVFRRHVQRLVKSVRKLVVRAPGVTIAFRGPHAFYKTTYKLLYSYWGLQYMDILRKEFAPLKNRVLYLDFWDMTVARTSYNIHPAKNMVMNMVRYMMSVLCFRN